MILQKSLLDKFRWRGLLLFSLLVIVGCTSSILKYNQKKDIFKNEEFEKKVEIKEVQSDPAVATPPVQLCADTMGMPCADKSVHVDKAVPTTAITVERPDSANEKEVQVGPLQTGGSINFDKNDQKPNSKNKSLAKKNKRKRKKSGKTEVDGRFDADLDTIANERSSRPPELEDNEGFGVARRPLIDPFRIGEKVVHTVSYFGTTAGILTFSIGHFVEVNRRKSYNFKIQINSSRLFSSFYSVQDQVESFVDYYDLVPHVFKLDIKESGQLRQAQAYFDQNELRANYWENKYTEKNGHEEKKQNWDILPYSQSAFSSIFYMRIFKWNTGQEYSFRVSDDEKNVIFKAKALGKVRLETDAGSFDAVKIKAEIVSRGALAQVGDLYLWLSDDDRRYILRIEAKIKIGTLVSEITSLEPGR